MDNELLNIPVVIVNDEILAAETPVETKLSKRKYQDGYITSNGLEIKGFISEIQKYICLSPCGCKKEITVSSKHIGKQKYCGEECPEYIKQRAINGKLGGQIAGKLTATRYSNEDVILSKRFKKIRRGSKVRNIEFHITKMDYKQLAFSPCVFCNEIDMKIIRGDKVVKINGIDRIDSKQGYVLGNIQSCCYKCNVMKGEMTEEEFLNHLKKITNHLQWRKH